MSTKDHRSTTSTDFVITKKSYKFLKNLLGVRDVEARSSGVQERKTCDQEGEGKRELLN